MGVGGPPNPIAAAGSGGGAICVPSGGCSAHIHTTSLRQRATSGRVELSASLAPPWGAASTSHVNVAAAAPHNPVPRPSFS